MKLNFYELGDIATVSAGQSAPQGSEFFCDGGTPFIRAGSLEFLTNGGSENNCEKVTDEAAKKHRLRLFPANTILFAKSGMSATLGRVYRLKKPCHVVSHLSAIIPGPKVFPSYLQRWFEKHPPSRLIPNESYPSIRLSEIKTLKVPLPTLSEQKRIAAILDRADVIRHKRQQAIQLANEFLRSVFLDMFGDPKTNPKGYPEVALGKLIIDGPQNGLYRPSKDYGSGTPILRIDSFYGGKIINLDKLKRVEIDSKIKEKYSLNIYDIIINRVNSRKFLGKSALVEELNETTVFESNMMRFSINQEEILPIFLIDLLQKEYIRNQILGLSRDAVNQSSINQNDVKSLKIILPPIERQIKYIGITDKLETIKDKKQSLSSYGELNYQSLIQRTFRGEL